MKGNMERFRMVQLSPDNARLELFDGDKSLGYFWTRKMAQYKIDEVLKSEPDMTFKVNTPKIVENKPIVEDVLKTVSRKNKR